MTYPTLSAVRLTRMSAETLPVVAVLLALCSWAGPERQSRELRLGD